MQIHAIVLGTDPASGRGGIGSALPSFFSTLERADISYDFIPTHSATAPGGRWRPWLRSFPRVVRAIRDRSGEDRRVVGYIHLGGGILSTFRKTVLAILIRAMGVPLIIKLHGPEVAGYLRSRIRCVLYRWALSPASALAVLTPFWAALLTRKGFAQPVFVIPNALNDQLEATARAKPQVTDCDGERRVLTMSRMVSGKGFELTAEAVPLIQGPIRFVFAGDGPLLDPLRRRIAALDCASRVTFAGWLSEEQKYAALREADLFCLPSSYDSFGMGFIEAMAHGVPVVALDWGPISDVVPHERCGILIDAHDPERLAEAIESVLSDEPRRIEMSRNAQAWVVESFSQATVAPRIRTMFENVLATEDTP